MRETIMRLQRRWIHTLNLDIQIKEGLEQLEYKCWQIFILAEGLTRSYTPLTNAPNVISHP